MSEKKTNKKGKASAKAKADETNLKDVTRSIKPDNKLLLYVRAGGRCEFDGCNEYLLSHQLTHKTINLGQMAHIVAFSTEGPRGDAEGGERPVDINNVDNLMLLCHRCHKLVDDHPEEYSLETLLNYKKAHEERIFWLTSASPDRQTSVVVLKSKIGGQTVKLSAAEIHEAVSPHYPASRAGTVIDLSKISDEGDAFYTVAAKEIKRQIERVVDDVVEEEKTNHVSLFALAPIPLLTYAGNLIGNKIPTDLFQRHRDSENWTWKTEGKLAEYKFEKIHEGTDDDKVILILSLSGKIHLEKLPAEVVEGANIYEITLDGASPNPTFLRQNQDLIAFKDIYQLALREIGSNHGKLEKLNLFPAVPAPVAVLCGRELMPKIDPILAVYDDDKRHAGYRMILEVNKYD
jgi:hypothetical protein